jgi:hypothetical protein
LRRGRRWRRRRRRTGEEVIDPRAVLLYMTRAILYLPYLWDLTISLLFYLSISRCIETSPLG